MIGKFVVALPVNRRDRTYPPKPSRSPTSCSHLKYACSHASAPYTALQPPTPSAKSGYFPPSKPETRRLQLGFPNGLVPSWQIPRFRPPHLCTSGKLFSWLNSLVCPSDKAMPVGRGCVSRSGADPNTSCSGVPDVWSAEGTFYSASRS